VGVSRGCRKFLKYPLLSQKWAKLRTSNLAVKFTVSIRTKAHSKLWRKGSVGVSRDCPKLVPDLWTTSLLHAYLGIILLPLWALFTCSQFPVSTCLVGIVRRPKHVSTGRGPGEPRPAITIPQPSLGEARKLLNT